MKHQVNSIPEHTVMTVMCSAEAPCRMLREFACGPYETRDGLLLREGEIWGLPLPPMGTLLIAATERSEHESYWDICGKLWIPGIWGGLQCVS